MVCQLPGNDCGNGFQTLTVAITAGRLDRRARVGVGIAGLPRPALSREIQSQRSRTVTSCPRVGEPLNPAGDW